MSLFNLGPAIGLLANDTVTVSRYSPDTYDDHGVRNPIALSSTFQSACSVQPVTGMMLKKADLAFEVSECVSIWCSKTLKLKDRLACAALSSTYVVEYLQPWESAGGYCKVIARRFAPQEPA